ncbi:MAG: DUF3095 domain-containing protein [Burkholderiales bacterium]|nr:DUF3095 domain-containing protein [Burkholderiales bacterium]
MPESLHFYRDLPALSSFAEVTEGKRHADLPNDWWIVVADVAGSTKAIEAGAYKDVNTVGVACIAAVVNVDRSIDLPFVFGGDGATFAIPDALRERVMMALRAAQQLSRDSFGLSLRVGLVSVAHLTENKYRVRMGKVQLSPHVTQPVLSGRGWEEAERLVKTPGSPDVVFVDENEGVADGSFEGFECRWQGVPSFNGHKLALLVAATSADAETNLDTYQRVFKQIEAIYGDVAQYHPLRAERMRMTFNPRLLAHEWRVRTSQLPIGKRLAYFAKMLLTNALGSYFFAFKRDTETVRWSQYPAEVVENSDFRKFDGMLRMVIDGSEEQSQQLERFLEAEHRTAKLAYGTHKSGEALMTCIVQNYNGNHQHFVDGSDGGYALAAKELKRRLVQVQQMKLQVQAASWLPAADATRSAG